MKYLTETALLTHGLRSISNEELRKNWRCPAAVLAWVDHGELRLGHIEDYLPFRERAAELVRIDCDHLEDALQNKISGALTASGTMAVCRKLGLPLAITCGMGGIGDLAGALSHSGGSHFHLTQGYAGYSCNAGMAASAWRPSGG